MKTLEELKTTVIEKMETELLPYKEELFELIKPQVKLSLTDAKEDFPLWKSNLNGNPYLPKGFNYPTEENGFPMKMIAQLNLEELPILEDYPEKGILQFYVKSGDDYFGRDDAVKVIYHENIIEDESQLVTDFSFLSSIDMEDWLYEEPDRIFTITGSLKYKMPDAQTIIRLKPKLIEKLEKDESIIGDSFAILDDLASEVNGIEEVKHQLGGHHCILQHDILEEKTQYDTLLFQLDSDIETGIYFWDMGIAGFFINKEKLRNKDFSDVLYDWECF